MLFIKNRNVAYIINTKCYKMLFNNGFSWWIVKIAFYNLYKKNNVYNLMSARKYFIFALYIGYGANMLSFLRFYFFKQINNNFYSARKSIKIFVKENAKITWFLLAF